MENNPLRRFAGEDRTAIGLAFALLSVAIWASPAQAEDAVAATILTYSSAITTQLERGTNTVQTRAAGPKPSVAIVDPAVCRKFRGVSEPLVQREVADDERIVGELLKDASPEYGHVLFAASSEEMMWWIRTVGSVSFVALSIGAHEASHAVHNALTRCNQGDATYFLKGMPIRTEHRFGDTPQYSILERMLPEHLKSAFALSRYRRYIEGSRNVPGNDFSILLDELVAYTGAAELEISLAQSIKYASLLDSKFDGFDGNAGGTVEFMAFIVAYLKCVRLEYPVAYDTLTRQPKLLGVLEQAWASGERSLVRLREFPQGSLGSKLSISLDALRTAYSADFLGELDRLGVRHAPENAWDTTYLRQRE